MIVMLLILFLAITTQSSVIHYNLSNNDYSIKLLCMKCILFCKFIGGETAHRRCLVLFVASCHCCASDPVLPFKEDFMAIFLLYSFSLLFPLCPSSFSPLVWNVFVIQSHAHGNCLYTGLFHSQHFC